jgi:hypothetical protein
VLTAADTNVLLDLALEVEAVMDVVATASNSRHAFH